MHFLNSSIDTKRSGSVLGTWNKA